MSPEDAASDAAEGFFQLGNAWRELAQRAQVGRMQAKEMLTDMVYDTMTKSV